MMRLHLRWLCRLQSLGWLLTMVPLPLCQPFANTLCEGHELAASLDLVDLEPADVEELVVELLASAVVVKVGVVAAVASWALVAALSVPPCHVADP